MVLSDDDDLINLLESGDNNNHKIKKNRRKRSWFGVRHTQVILIFLLLLLEYAMRVNLSVAIVAMTDPTLNPHYNFPTYNWKDVSVIFSSFYWGYILFPMITGPMSQIFGSRWICAISMLLNSLACMMIPVMAQFGSWGVMICYIIEGACQGAAFPCTQYLLGRWAPIQERSRLGAFVYSGCQFGTVISLPLTGWICSSRLGWPSAFYIFGSFGVIWALAWSILGRNSPSEHSTIDSVERTYIEASLGGYEKNLKLPTPWKAILTSKPIWANLAAQCGHSWGFFTLLTETPTYMNDVLGFDIKSNGLLSACPYMVNGILSFLFSSITDYIINKKYVSVSVARKLANTVGLCGPGLTFIALGILKLNRDYSGVAVALLITSVGLNAGVQSGFLVNHNDLSPRFSGTTMGLTNSLSTICSILGPLAVHFIVTVNTSADQWATVFYLAACVSISGGIIFATFGEGTLQEWDTPKYEIHENGSVTAEDKVIKSN